MRTAITTNVLWLLSLAGIWWLTLTQMPPGVYVWHIEPGGGEVIGTKFAGKAFSFAAIALAASLPFVAIHIVNHRGRIPPVSYWRFAAFATGGMAYAHADLVALGVWGSFSMLGRIWILLLPALAISAVAAFAINRLVLPREHEHCGSCQR